MSPTWTRSGQNLWRSSMKTAERSWYLAATRSKMSWTRWSAGTTGW